MEMSVVCICLGLNTKTDDIRNRLIRHSTQCTLVSVLEKKKANSEDITQEEFNARN